MDVLGKDTAKLLRDPAVRKAVHEVLDQTDAGRLPAERTVEVKDDSKGTLTVTVRLASQSG